MKIFETIKDMVSDAVEVTEEAVKHIQKKADSALERGKWNVVEGYKITKEYSEKAVDGVEFLIEDGAKMATDAGNKSVSIAKKFLEETIKDLNHK